MCGWLLGKYKSWWIVIGCIIGGWYATNVMFRILGPSLWWLQFSFRNLGIFKAERASGARFWWLGALSNRKRLVANPWFLPALNRIRASLSDIALTIDFESIQGVAYLSSSFKRPHSADMPKGRGCDRKRQAKEDWIRAVALLRLWGCDKGVSNVSLLARQRRVLVGSEGAKNSTQAIWTTEV